MTTWHSSASAEGDGFEFMIDFPALAIFQKKKMELHVCNYG